MLSSKDSFLVFPGQPTNETRVPSTVPYRPLPSCSQGNFWRFRSPTDRCRLTARIESSFYRDRSAVSVVRTRSLKMPLQNQTLTQGDEPVGRNNLISSCFQARPHWRLKVCSFSLARPQLSWEFSLLIFPQSLTWFSRTFHGLRTWQLINPGSVILPHPIFAFPSPCDIHRQIFVIFSSITLCLENKDFQKISL